VWDRKVKVEVDAKWQLLVVMMCERFKKLYEVDRYGCLCQVI
jgi:hypothetical protein